MRVFCEGVELSNAVMTVIKATSSKTTNPILEGIKLVAEDEWLTLSATDGELAIEKKIPADVKLSGEIVVPGKLFSEFVKKLSSEQIQLILDEKNQLKIKYTDSELFIQCQSASEFPSIKQIENAQFFTMKQTELKDVIDRTIFSVATDDTRPVLKGCLFEQDKNILTSVALDGFRLAIAKKRIKECSAESSIIVPARSLSEISKLLVDGEQDIRVLIERNYMMVIVDGTKIVTRCLGTKDDFINYKQIIPSSFASTVTISKSQLLSTLERASILSHVGGDNSVKFEIEGNIMKVTAKSEAGTVTENITISLVGEDLSIAFNISFFMDCLRNIQSDYVMLKFNGQVNPCFILPNDEGDEYVFLVSPIRQVY
ncbi:MAG TPA: DNA polymerase III subunit beta [Clostridiales bacterium]|nr:DNA polymerase III subunit beta [Clostridiales bacterium]